MTTKQFLVITKHTHVFNNEQMWSLYTKLAGRPHTPPTNWMYVTDVRHQTDRRQTASSLNVPWAWA